MEELNKKQKRKYRNQFIGIMVSMTLLGVGLLYGLGSAIIHFFNTYDFMYLANVICYSYIFFEIMQTGAKELPLIAERIEKRKKKNKRQNNNGKKEM